MDIPTVGQCSMFNHHSQHCLPHPSIATTTLSTPSNVSCNNSNGNLMQQMGPNSVQCCLGVSFLFLFLTNIIFYCILGVSIVLTDTKKDTMAPMMMMAMPLSWECYGQWERWDKSRKHGNDATRMTRMMKMMVRDNRSTTDRGSSSSIREQPGEGDANAKDPAPPPLWLLPQWRRWQQQDHLHHIHSNPKSPSQLQTMPGRPRTRGMTRMTPELTGITAATPTMMGAAAAVMTRTNQEQGQKMRGEGDNDNNNPNKAWHRWQKPLEQPMTKLFHGFGNPQGSWVRVVTGMGMGHW